MVKIGYSRWGFPGPGVIDTPNLSRSYRRWFVDGSIAAGYKVVFGLSAGLTQAREELSGWSTPDVNDATGNRIGRATSALVAALVATAALAGCEPDGEASPEPPAGSPAAPVPSPAVSVSPEPMDPAEEALAVYVAMWDAYDAAAQDPLADPGDLALERYAAGDALAMVKDLVASLREDGLVAEGSIDHSPQLTQLSPEEDSTSVRVEDCADTSDQTVVRADGGRYEDDPGGLRLIFADVQLREGVWKVTELGIGRVGSCQR